MTSFDQFACPVMSAAACLKHYNAGTLFRHEVSELISAQLLSKLHMPFHRGAVELEHTLSQIHSDHHAIHIAFLSAAWLNQRFLRTLQCRLGRAATTPSTVV